MFQFLVLSFRFLIIILQLNSLSYIFIDRFFKFFIAIQILLNYNFIAHEKSYKKKKKNTIYSVSIDEFALMYLIMQRISPSLCGRSRSI